MIGLKLQADHHPSGAEPFQEVPSPGFSRSSRLPGLSACRRDHEPACLSHHQFSRDFIAASAINRLTAWDSLR
jgi:hypothetical protein